MKDRDEDTEKLIEKSKKIMEKQVGVLEKNNVDAFVSILDEDGTTEMYCYDDGTGTVAMNLIWNSILQLMAEGMLSNDVLISFAIQFSNALEAYTEATMSGDFDQKVFDNIFEKKQKKIFGEHYFEDPDDSEYEDEEDDWVDEDTDDEDDPDSDKPKGMLS